MPIRRRVRSADRDRERITVLVDVCAVVRDDVAVGIERVDRDVGRDDAHVLPGRRDVRDLRCGDDKLDGVDDPVECGTDVVRLTGADDGDHGPLRQRVPARRPGLRLNPPA